MLPTCSPDVTRLIWLDRPPVDIVERAFPSTILIASTLPCRSGSFAIIVCSVKSSYTVSSLRSAAPNNRVRHAIGKIFREVPPQ